MTENIKEVMSQQSSFVKAEFLSVIFLILLQLGGGLWWASAMSTRVQNLETILNRADRFTSQDGALLAQRIEHNSNSISELKEFHRDLGIVINEMRDDQRELIILINGHTASSNGDYAHPPTP